MSVFGDGVKDMSVEQAADQLINYLYPNREWIGYHWIDREVFVRMSANLRDALDRAKAARNRTRS